MIVSLNDEVVDEVRFPVRDSKPQSQNNQMNIGCYSGKNGKMRFPSS